MGIDLHARMLFLAGGVRFALRIEQGVERGRPSLLRLEVTGEGGAAKIRVGGRVFESARGELL